MRDAIQQLVARGRIPEDDAVSDEDLDWYGDVIDSLERPLTNEEAAALYTILGDHLLYGLTWSLIHLIESAPDWPIWTCFDQIKTEHQERLHRRARNGLQHQTDHDSSA